MKRKIENSDIEMKIIYKLAWSFHNTTGIDLEDLIGEASVAYVEALHEWDEKTCLSTSFAYTIIRNRLTNYIQKQNPPTKSLDDMVIEPYESDEDEEFSYDDLTKNWTQDCKEIIEIIRYTPLKFYNMPPKKARGRLVKILRNKGWAWPRVWSSIREIKINLNKKNIICII